MVLKRRARVITYGGGVNPKRLRVSRCSSSYGVDLEGRLDAIERRLDQIEDELQATRQENAALRRRMDEFEATYQEMIRFVQHSRRTQDGSSTLPSEGAPQVNNHRVLAPSHKTLEEQYSDAVDRLTSGMCGTARQNENLGREGA